MTVAQNFLVSCENDKPCDYTSISVVLLGFALSMGIAISIYHKQREITRKLDQHATSHVDIATDEISTYLQSIHEFAVTWISSPLNIENFQDSPNYRGMMRKHGYNTRYLSHFWWIFKF